MPLGRRIASALALLALLSGCASPEAGGGSASIARHPDSGAASAAPAQPGTPSGSSAAPGDAGDFEAPSTSANPSEAPSGQASAAPSTQPSPTPSNLADYRASGLWHDLGTAQQAGGVVETVMKWRNPEGSIGPIPNGPALWSQVMPPLRDHLLTRHIKDGAIPTPAFAGTPYQTPQSVRVVTWWTNGPSGTGGRGQMVLVIAGWKSAQGVDHIDMWPVLIGFGAGVEGTTKAGRINAVGPLTSMPTAELNPDQGAAFAAISAKIKPWVDSQPITEDPLEFPCPQTGCST